MCSVFWSSGVTE